MSEPTVTNVTTSVKNESEKWTEKSQHVHRCREALADWLAG